MSAKRTRLLVVEDDPGLRRELTGTLEAFEVDYAATGAQALHAVRRKEPAIVLQDLGRPAAADGVEERFATLTALARVAPRAKFIIVTGREDREHALRAIRLGAYDFCPKPLDTRVLSLILERARFIHQLEAENRQLAEDPARLGREGILAASEPMLGVCRLIRKLAPTEATALLLGESGTGKERLARALHALSPRARRPLVAINCAAIPEPLLESELFGYERGAYTGAMRRTPGKIETASGGTLFLDEIGDMPLALQAKLLRFLQERFLERLGGREMIPVDVRIVAATHRDLKAEVARGRFRQDLYYRLAEVPVVIPPLRERGSDTVLIAGHLLQQFCRRHGKPALTLAPDAIAAIERHAWPGNVRELENRLNAAVIMSEGKVIRAADLALEPVAAQTTGVLPLREVRRQAEAAAVTRALEITGGNIARAAELLGVTRPTFYVVMRQAFARTPKRRQRMGSSIDSPVNSTGLESVGSKLTP